ncbi:hypothetical protein C2G38_2171349 [Gigaspora rosea]|uniref:Uncharacterized protein n=1 Tax=Gigaspora rosea TaxID=44941 RepID=A0A397VNE5_9GLOM|nr:hypothetical protein C2G38_2171349 [Gigaspora rosea]
MLDIVICNNAFNELKKSSLETFNRNGRNYLRKFPIKLLHFINRHEVFNELKKGSLKIICENPKLLFNSNEFLSLEKDVLILILKCDDLDMKESEIWKQLIKWGVVKHPTFQSDVKKFTSKQFETLEKTLHELIQFVRFHQINGEEFMLEVWPFSHLLPDNLIEDIFSYDKVSSENRYKFNLLFRKKRDSFSFQTFHQICDHKGATIVITQISNSNMLVDGYNPLDLNRNTVYCDHEYGPIFGDGHDLYAPNNNNRWKHNRSSYQDI